MTPLSLSTSRTRATTTVALTGELDLAGTAALEQEPAAVEDGGVVLDLRGRVFEVTRMRERLPSVDAQEAPG